MDALLASALLFSLCVVIALTMASALLAEARAEFQGRLRDLALRRAKRLLAVAAVAAAGVAALVGYVGWPEDAAPLGVAHAGELRIGRDLKLSTRLSGASGLGAHLGEQQDVADRR